MYFIPLFLGNPTSIHTGIKRIFWLPETQRRPHANSFQKKRGKKKKKRLKYLKKTTPKHSRTYIVCTVPAHMSFSKYQVVSKWRKDQMCKLKYKSWLLYASDKFKASNTPLCPSCQPAGNFQKFLMLLPTQAENTRIRMLSTSLSRT